MAFDQKPDTEEQGEDVERWDYFWKVLVDLDREVGKEVDKEEVADKWHKVELDSIGWVSEKTKNNEAALKYSTLGHRPLV